MSDRHMQPSYEFFDHTADIGVRVRARTLRELVAPAVEGMYAVIGELVTTGEATLRTLDLTDGDEATLLRDLLAELLFAFELDALQAIEIEVVEFTNKRLLATIKMASVDNERSQYHREVKAITYHELAIRPIANGYEAVYIVDI